MRDALGEVQSVLVLGGSSEIGLAVVRALAARRALRVVLAVRQPAAVEREQAAELLKAPGVQQVDVVAFDALAPPAAHDATSAEAFARLGSRDVDLALVAAGLLGDQAAVARDPAAAREIVETGFSGLVSAVLAVVERMRAQGHGTVVVLSSVAGERPRKANFVYGSAKAGLDAFAQGLGDALQGTGVRVLVVRPGFVATRMTAGLKPAPLATTPEGVANEVVRGLASGAHTVWAPPVLRWVMLVLRVLPRALFRRLPG